MKNKIIEFLIVSSFFIILLEVLLNRQIVFNTISYSMNTWIKSILPPMAPFFVITDILISYNITNYIPKHFKKILVKLFNVREEIISIFLLSLISGFPNSARITNKMYIEGKITKEEASHALIFTHFSNPMFIYSVVGISFLNNSKYGLIILISHYLGNIFLAIITRNASLIKHIDYTSNEEKSKEEKKKNFSLIFIKSIKSSIDTLLLILGTLTAFLILSSLIIHKLSLPPYHSMIIKGILEITMGLKSLSLLHIPDIYKVIIATCFLSFGGLSVHMQMISQLTDSNIPYFPSFIARIFHSIISGIISYTLFILLI